MQVMEIKFSFEIAAFSRTRKVLVQLTFYFPLVSLPNQRKTIGVDLMPPREPSFFMKLVLFLFQIVHTETERKEKNIKMKFSRKQDIFNSSC